LDNAVNTRRLTRAPSRSAAANHTLAFTTPWLRLCISSFAATAGSASERAIARTVFMGFLLRKREHRAGAVASYGRAGARATVPCRLRSEPRTFSSEVTMPKDKGLERGGTLGQEGELGEGTPQRDAQRGGQERPGQGKNIEK